jgi:hypothetical protein
MGITFRDGSYVRRVKVGKRTIKEGEGASREVIGPSLRHLFYSTIKFMDHHIARPNQYVVIEHKDGKIEHLPGPHSIYFNPIKHTSVVVNDAIELPTPSDCIIVASSQPPAIQNTTPGDYVVRGYAQYMPQINEKVVAHEWTLDPTNSSAPHKPVQGHTTKFTRLTTRPFRFPITMPLKTKEGMTIQIEYSFSLMVEEVELAIAIADPIAAIHMALQSDLAKIGPQLAEAFLAKPDPEQLASIHTYAGTIASAVACGFKVLDVQVLSVGMPPELLRQKEVRMAANSAHQAQMEATKRKAEVCRVAADAKLEAAAQEEKIATTEFEVATRKEMHEFELNSTRQAHTLELAAAARTATTDTTRKQCALLAGFLGQLKAVDVDLTAYLSSMAPAKSDPRSGVAAASGLQYSYQPTAQKSPKISNFL